MKNFYVYIATNHSRTLYVGVTSNLEQRMAKLRSGFYSGSFTSRYRIAKLVYYEAAAGWEGAIMREKQIKGMRRSRKIELIESVNPEWEDLSGELSRPVTRRAV